MCADGGNTKRKARMRTSGAVAGIRMQEIRIKADNFVLRGVDKLLFSCKMYVD
jgi:hypothetical protein